jgi:hypothetical protein
VPQPASVPGIAPSLPEVPASSAAPDDELDELPEDAPDEAPDDPDEDPVAPDDPPDDPPEEAPPDPLPLSEPEVELGDAAPPHPVLNAPIRVPSARTWDRKPFCKAVKTSPHVLQGRWKNVYL